MATVSTGTPFVSRATENVWRKRWKWTSSRSASVARDARLRRQSSIADLSFPLPDQKKYLSPGSVFSASSVPYQWFAT